MIPENAVEAAAKAIHRERGVFPWDEINAEGRGYLKREAYKALEAALPILLSHEREETRLAHLDAVVNAAEVDRLEGEIARAKADAWDEGYAMRDADSPHESDATNPYRSEHEKRS